MKTRASGSLRFFSFRRCVGLLSIAGLLCAGWWAFDLTRPHYRGHTAAWWFAQLELGQGANREVVTAFQAMGPKEVPFLIFQLEARPSKARAALDSVLIRLRPHEPYERRLLFRKENASRLLGEIGQPARTAIPALEAAACHPMWFVSTAAKAALIKIRGDAFDSYIKRLKDRSNCLTWYPNAILLGELGTNASAAVPLLLEALKDTNAIIQAHALVALGMIGCQSERCVPAIIPFLTNIDVGLRQKAFFAVRAFKKEAHAARQEIMRGLTDSDPWTRSQALLAVDEVLSSGSPHKTGFVTVNKVKLHYLDWGGSGETLLFLHGMGDTPHRYDDFAPKFTNQFRVLGLTRRGHGESEIPETGYDTATLVEDIRQFLDALRIQRVILAGHSFAGDELTRFAVVHADRVIKLIYFDSAYDHSRVPESLRFKPLHGWVPELSPPRKKANHPRAGGIGLSD